MHIMIGLPGSGKSTKVQEIVKSSTSYNVCSADHFFERNGIYIFDASKLYIAHLQCKNKAEQSVLKQIDDVIIDNTNLSKKERKFYVDLANQHGYTVVYHVFNPNDFNLQVLADRNVHGVTLEILEKMKLKFSLPE